MWFHLGLQPAAGRTSAVDQMCDHKVHRLCGRELPQGQHRLQGVCVAMEQICAAAHIRSYAEFRNMRGVFTLAMSH